MHQRILIAMTVEVCGMRQTVIAVFHCHIDAAPPWNLGPLPYAHDGPPVTTRLRETLFNSRTARVLYGEEASFCRWNLTPEELRDSRASGQETEILHLDGVELLRAAIPIGVNPTSTNGFAILHLQVRGGKILEVLRELAGRGGQASPVLPILLRAADSYQPRRESIPVHLYTLSLSLTPSEFGLSPLYPVNRYQDWAINDQWLWALASRTRHDDYPPDPSCVHSLLSGAICLSADWHALVLRDGASFLGVRPDAGDSDQFFGYAERHFRTIYLDTLLLGMLQQHDIDALAEQTAAAFDNDDFTAYVCTLEARIAQFRGTYWWQHLTSHGHSNDLLRAYQAEHRLPERFTQILQEAEESRA